jgi:hypothetical protein
MIATYFPRMSVSSIGSQAQRRHPRPWALARGACPTQVVTESLFAEGHLRGLVVTEADFEDP